MESAKITTNSVFALNTLQVLSLV